MSMNWFEEILNQSEWVLPWSCAGSHVPVLVLWLWMAALSPLGSLAGMRCDENERPVEQNISPPSRLEPSNWCTTKKKWLLSASAPPKPNPLISKRIFSRRPTWSLKTGATRVRTNGDSIISGFNAVQITFSLDQVDHPHHPHHHQQSRVHGRESQGHGRAILELAELVGWLCGAWRKEQVRARRLSTGYRWTTLSEFLFFRPSSLQGPTRFILLPKIYDQPAERKSKLLIVLRK